MMNLIIAVDALIPPLTGIGRYTKELVSRIQVSEDIVKLKYYLNGRWVKEPLTIPISGQVVYETRKLPKALGQLYVGQYVKKAVFHSPNFFLPSTVERGVATIHDLSVLKFPETHPLERIQRFEQRLLTTLGVAQHLITPSETIRQEVIDYFGWPSHRNTAIDHGVADTCRPQSRAEVRTLKRYGLTPNAYTLCVSTIEPRKRIENLIKAYSMLPLVVKARFPLVLVGDKGWQSEHQHHVIDAAQRAGWLSYLGFVDEVDLPLIYAGARLFVYPSIYEGFGLPVAEAMASGVPVITSSKSCLPEVASGAAKLVDPDDLIEFASSLEVCLQDEDWREAAVQRGLKVAKKYHWQQCAEQTIAVYKKIK